VARGWGFLAVFVAGILIGDAGAPYKREVERFHSALANLEEIVAFLVLGITVEISTLARTDVWLPRLVLGLVQGGLVPAAVRPLRLPTRAVQPEPWALGVRMRAKPAGVHRLRVAPGAPADGVTIADEAERVGQDMWAASWFVTVSSSRSATTPGFGPATRWWFSLAPACTTILRRPSRHRAERERGTIGRPATS